jgi:nitrate reductase gamma subunit
MFARLQALLAALWGGLLLCIAFVATPSAFAVLERAHAGAYVARVFAIEAQVSLVLGLVLMMIERRISRDAAEAGAARDQFSARLLLPAMALFCTIAGYYGLQPLMAEARAGAGVASFAALHGASLALFGLKGLAVLALAWITQRRAS